MALETYSRLNSKYLQSYKKGIPTLSKLEPKLTSEIVHLP